MTNPDSPFTLDWLGQGPIRDDIRELVEAAGAVFHQSFTKKTTHLICYRAESEIYAKVLRGPGGAPALRLAPHAIAACCAAR